MPLFDLHCLSCGKTVEKLFKKLPDFYTYNQLTKKEKAHLKEIQAKLIPGYELIYECNTRFAHQVCDCAGFQEVVTPLTNMQPDSMWFGVQTGQGYFTSKSEYQQVLKQKGLESVSARELEGIRKKVKQTRKAKFDKQLNNLTAHIEKELANVEVSPDGNTTKQKRKFINARTRD